MCFSPPFFHLSLKGLKCWNIKSNTEQTHPAAFTCSSNDFVETKSWAREETCLKFAPAALGSCGVFFLFLPPLYLMMRLGEECFLWGWTKEQEMVFLRKAREGKGRTESGNCVAPFLLQQRVINMPLLCSSSRPQVSRCLHSSTFGITKPKLICPDTPNSVFIKPCWQKQCGEKVYTQRLMKSSAIVQMLHWDDPQVPLLSFCREILKLFFPIF